MNGETIRKLAAEIGEVTALKNDAYGDSAGRAGVIMRVLYPDGIRPDQYDDALLVVRVLDKLSRLATDPAAFGESPWRDIAGYGLVAAALQRTSNGEPELSPPDRPPAPGCVVEEWYGP